MTHKLSPDDPVYVFDLDGVITNPHTTTIDNEAIGHIVGLLDSGSYVAINTGRSYGWVQAHLIAALQNTLGAHTFERLYIVCEKGGESIKWEQDSFVPDPSRFALPAALYNRCRELYEAHAQELSTMFWDSSKRTMGTYEKYPDAAMEQYLRERTLLVRLLSTALKDHNVKIDQTVSATDVELPEAGKHAGAELIYAWMQSDAGHHRHFISFGDSPSDYEMARYFAEQGAQSQFIFVGEPTVIFAEDERVTLTRTQERFALGTREYFQQHA